MTKGDILIGAIFALEWILANIETEKMLFYSEIWHTIIGLLNMAIDTISIAGAMANLARDYIPSV